jgi:hypothetical protein
MRRYDDLTNGDATLALQLYHWNAALSEALHCPLLSLEITLRNAVNDCLGAEFGEAWYDNPKSALRQAQLQQIQSAKTHLALARKSANPHNVVSNLSLGFWVGLFSPKYEISLWRTQLRRIFNRGPKVLLRVSVHGRLDRFRQLRNRVAHHEPIQHLPLVEEYCSILEVLEWLCLPVALYTARQSQFLQILENRPGTTR